MTPTPNPFEEGTLCNAHFPTKPLWLRYLIRRLLYGGFRVYVYERNVVAYIPEEALMSHMLWANWERNPLSLKDLNFQRMLLDLPPEQHAQVLAMFHEAIDLMPKEEPYRCLTSHLPVLPLRSRGRSPSGPTHEATGTISSSRTARASSSSSMAETTCGG